MKLSQKLLALICCSLIAALSACTSESSKPTAYKSLGVVSDFRLLDQNGESHQFRYHTDAKAIVLISQGNGCPISRLLYSKLENLKNKYHDKGIKFFMLNANLQDDHKSILKEATKYKSSIPILIDTTQQVAHTLKIKRTAEALLVNPQDWSILYRGAIDDSLSYEIQKTSTKNHFLEDALTAFINNDEILTEKTNTKGCLINYSELSKEHGDSISYANQVVPILQKNCLACHREGGVAPWAMKDYHTVYGWSAMMREVLLNRRMPPWRADTNYGDFIYSHELTDQDRKTLIQWIDAGSKNNDQIDPLKEIHTPTPKDWQLGTPDLVVTSEEQSIPATGTLPYKHSVIKIDIDEDKWVKALEFLPSNPKVVHHIILFIKYPRHRRDEQPDWMSGKRGQFAAFGPGIRTSIFPENTGKLIPKGSKLMFQFHYVTTGVEEVDQTKVAFYFSDKKPKHILRTDAVYNDEFILPPHEQNLDVEGVYLFDEDSVIISVGPHMHYRGKKMKLFAEYPDGKEELFFSLPYYDFNWQFRYTLKEPKFIPAGTKLIARGAFDNSRLNLANPNPDKQLKWGLQAHNEMFLSYFTYAKVKGASKEITSEFLSE